MGCNSSLAVDSCCFRSEDAFLNEYSLGKRLGAGNFGTVHHATDRKCRTHAVKVLECADKASQEECFKESILLRRASGHKHIVRFHDAFGMDETHYIVMEACKCSVIAGIKAGHVSSQALPKYFQQMVLGLAHCHALGIVHRDVKPDNFLLGGPSGEEIKLTDFGLATVLPKQKMLYDVVGTSPYMSPELIGRSGYDERTDVWSLGATAYLMLFGTYPYMPKESTQDAMKATIKKGVPCPSFKTSEDPKVHGIEQSDDSMEFVKMLLTREKTRRISMTEVLALPFVDVARVTVALHKMSSALKSPSSANSGSTCSGGCTFSRGSCSETSVSM